MNSRGFSLIELVVVIGLIAILLSMATFGFSRYSLKAKMASQTRLLYGDLMEYRSKALYEKKSWTFKLSATGYAIYSSPITTVTPVSTKNLRYSIESTMPIIEFDSHGRITQKVDIDTIISADGAICISGANDAVVDSLAVYSTMVGIGKRKDGFSCAAANINAQ